MAVSNSPSFSAVAAEIGISLPKSLAALVQASKLADKDPPFSLLDFAGYSHSAVGYPFISSLVYSQTYDRFQLSAYSEGTTDVSGRNWEFNVVGAGYAPETGVRVLYGSGGQMASSGKGSVSTYSGGAQLTSGYGNYAQPPYNKAVYMVGRTKASIAAGTWSPWGNQKPYTIPGSGGSGG